MRNGLPPTTTDSFVYEAAEHAEHIYGDEGIDGPPPMNALSRCTESIPADWTVATRV